MIYKYNEYIYNVITISLGINQICYDIDPKTTGLGFKFQYLKKNYFVLTWVLRCIT